MAHPSHLNVHDFWLQTCGYDTHHRSPDHAQQDTPWNYFSPNGVLVCTIWRDFIADVDDGGETRRFITLGGKMGAWRGPAVPHGEQADANMQRAMKMPLKERRIVGFKAEPAISKHGRRVKHFYMDDVYELLPVVGLRGDELIARLHLRAELQARDRELESMLTPGTVFELVPLRGPRPCADAPPTPIAEQAKPGGDEDSNANVGVIAGYAKQTLKLLVEHVRACREDVIPQLTYGGVAAEIGWFDKNGKPNALRMGQVLHHVMEMIDSVGARWQEQLPFLTLIVVAATGGHEGLPGRGVESRWPDYPSLTDTEKKTRVLAEYSRLIAFGPRWDLVLEQLGLAAAGSHHRTWGSGGESAAHRALKMYVQNHPLEFGAELSHSAHVEYALRSGDVIDVFFRGPHEWIGVEVKSRLSDQMIEDYERGIYQVIKYRAVLQAQANADFPYRPPKVRVLLVLESHLPGKYRDLAQRFSVEVREAVAPGHEVHAHALTAPTEKTTAARPA